MELWPYLGGGEGGGARGGGRGRLPHSGKTVVLVFLSFLKFPANQFL